MNETRAYSVAILGEQNSREIKKKGSTLSFGRELWQVKQEPLWQGRHVRLQKVSQKLRNAFKKIARSPGKQLCDAYIAHIHSTQPPFFGMGKSAIRMKTTAAFLLAGVCEVKKGTDNSGIKSTKKAIDARTIKRLDYFSSCSPVRLAYEFMAKNKPLPKRYLSEVLQPDLIASLVKKGVDKKTARLVVTDQLKKCGILKGKHISLESMIELKNRLRHFAIDHQSSPTFDDVKKPRLSSVNGTPSLTPPQVRPGYECDKDDVWMINHTVKHARAIRIAGDVTKRILHWAQRNKRTALIVTSGLALEILLGGLFSGGIGAAVAGLVSLGTTIAPFVWDRAILEIRSAFSKYVVRRWEKNGKNDNGFDNFLDSCAYLTSQKGVTQILNAYHNLEKSVNRLKKQHNHAGTTVKNQVKYQKQKALMQLRREQLQQCFGLVGSDNPGNSGSYDRLIVETVQEISRLEHEFENEFNELWAPFENMPDEKRWQVFNKAANHRSVQNRWYEVSCNHQKWIQDSFKNGSNGLSAKLKQAFSDIPSAKKEIISDFSKLHNWNMNVFAKTAKMVSATFLNFAYQIGKSVAGSTKELHKLLSHRQLVSVKDFLPKQWGPFVVVWAFYYFGEKIAHAINRSANASRVAAIHKDSLNRRFDTPGVVLSKDQWYALRREAKGTIENFVDTLKELRDEHRQIKKLLARKTNGKQMSEDKRNQKYAMALLRRKVLEKKLNTLLASAVGHMHEETIRAVWHQQQALGALEVV